ncbi:hypothetical protein KJA17_01075 [Patescibacteria group bacterium]|nr:hypothetical protein [Patescibacteria group bacterium]
MFSHFSKTILVVVLVLVVILPNFRGFAQTPTEEREALEAELRELEEQIAQYEEDITKTQQEKRTLQNEIYILRKKIEKLDYQIYRNNLIIKDLNFQIGDTQTSIDKTNLKIAEVKENLANILQLRYEEDQRTLLEIFLAEQTLSDFFDNLMALEALNLNTQELLADIKGLKSSLESQKDIMVEEKEDLEDVITIQVLQKQESATTKKTQEYFLKLTEAEYQKYLKEKEGVEKKASEIRARIYELIGVREAVTYEEALEIAKYAAGQIGIRPALLLGVLSQESAIGRNVGQCYLKNTSTGAGVVARTGTAIFRVMNPERDVPYFLEIIKELNKNKGLALDPFETLVSCPMSFGWGGAMGPAQFIPDTWANPRYGYKLRVEKIIGNTADPWDIRDASLAASLYLKDGLDNYGTEGKAIQAYFCGYPKGTYWCRWYEKNVLYLTQCHQSFIAEGAMSLECQEAVGLR